jgi:hypothetical protein
MRATNDSAASDPVSGDSASATGRRLSRRAAVNQGERTRGRSRIDLFDLIQTKDDFVTLNIDDCQQMILQLHCIADRQFDTGLPHFDLLVLRSGTPELTPLSAQSELYQLAPASVNRNRGTNLKFGARYHSPGAALFVERVARLPSGGKFPRMARRTDRRIEAHRAQSRRAPSDTARCEHGAPDRPN